MDDFLEKPIRSNELIDVLHRWVPSASSPAVAQSVERPADAIEIVDARVFDALQASLGTPALVKAIELHLEQAVTSILAIERAANDNRVEDVATEAHRLRGGAYTLGFQRMGALCAALEDDASRHTKTERLELVGRLHRACWELREFVSAWNLTGTAS
jgi:HPt (histidine-containing phosphotransfer) domain-containing protein